MIKLWLSNKFRFIADLLFFFFCFSFLFLPWYIALLILALALGADFLAFDFQKKGAAE